VLLLSASGDPLLRIFAHAARSALAGRLRLRAFALRLRSSISLCSAKHAFGIPGPECPEGWVGRSDVPLMAWLLATKGGHL
jgi:hypothetical protein